MCARLSSRLADSNERLLDLEVELITEREEVETLTMQQNSLKTQVVFTVSLLSFPLWCIASMLCCGDVFLIIYKKIL